MNKKMIILYLICFLKIVYAELKCIGDDSNFNCTIVDTNNIEYGFYITNSLRITSTILSLIVLISYVFKNTLKSKKSNDIIIYLSFSILMFSATSLFAINNPKKLQCVDSITQSVQSNNKLCTIQGSLLVFSSFSTIV